jgi:hypothetical protein
MFYRITEDKKGDKMDGLLKIKVDMWLRNSPDVESFDSVYNDSVFIVESCDYCETFNNFKTHFAEDIELGNIFIDSVGTMIIISLV